MGRMMVTGYIAVMFIVLAAASGCRDGAPMDDLDRFMDRMESLEGQALQDTLSRLAEGSGPQAVYASFALGNRFYQQAGDTAMQRGWNDETANALLDTAQVFFEKAVALDSTFIQGLVNLGSLWDDRSEQMSPRAEKDERQAKAESYYRQALTIDPHDEKARCNLGALFLRQRRTGDAMQEFQTVLDHDPGSALAHYHMAIMFAEAKIYREAIREWELASKHDPDGDIGDRSRENVKIVKDLMNAPTPASVQ